MVKIGKQYCHFSVYDRVALLLIRFSSLVKDRVGRWGGGEATTPSCAYVVAIRAFCINMFKSAKVVLHGLKGQPLLS